MPYYLSFTQEIPRYKPTVEPSFPSAFRHTWSLAIEEQFYLVWPPFFWWFGQETPADCRGLTLIALAVAARSQNFSAFILVTHLDGLALGGLLAGMLAESKTARAEYWRRFGFRLRGLGLGSAALYVAATLRPGSLDMTWPGLVPAAAIYMFRPLFLSLTFFCARGHDRLVRRPPALRLLRDHRLVYLGIDQLWDLSLSSFYI